MVPLIKEERKCHVDSDCAEKSIFLFFLSAAYMT